MKAGDRVDIYEGGVYVDSGVILMTIKGGDPETDMAQVLADSDADDYDCEIGSGPTYWVSLSDLRDEGDDDPGYDPSPSGYEDGGMFPTYALID